jgi:ACDE family multidrug resistance protein
MLERRIPEWLRHSPTPSVNGFALLAGFEAVARGILISVFPLIMYRALEDASVVSSAYFQIGIISLVAGLLVPWLNNFIPRRWLYSVGALLFAVGSLMAMSGEPRLVVAGLACNAIATVTTFICFNAYVLDYIAKVELGHCETQRMFYSALGWTIGPVAGVTLMQWWYPAPFLIAAAAAICMLVAFLYLRMGNGRQITRAKAPATNPLAFLKRFFAQPRLIAGWLFAVIRSCGWWVYVVYLPIFCVENGLGDQLGGIVLSIANGTLFLTPLFLRWTRTRPVRASVRLGFLAAGLLFLTAGLVAFAPPLSVTLLVFGSFFLILLDMVAGLPFLMAVKPSERTEMSAVYSSYRDVSGILTPGGAWLVLLVAPIQGVFVAGGAALLVAWVLAGTLHSRLGTVRVAQG